MLTGVAAGVVPSQDGLWFDPVEVHSMFRLKSQKVLQDLKQGFDS